MRRASCSLLGHSTALSASDPQSLPPSLYAVCLLASVHDGRASARSQVDDIVSGGEESADDNFRERLHKELDADRISRYVLPPLPAARGLQTQPHLHAAPTAAS